MEQGPKKSKAFIITFIAVIILLVVAYLLFSNKEKLFTTKSSTKTETKTYVPLDTSKQKQAETDASNQRSALIRQRQLSVDEAQDKLRQAESDYAANPSAANKKKLDDAALALKKAIDDLMKALGTNVSDAILQKKKAVDDAEKKFKEAEALYTANPNATTRKNLDDALLAYNNAIDALQQAVDDEERARLEKETALGQNGNGSSTTNGTSNTGTNTGGTGSGQSGTGQGTATTSTGFSGFVKGIGTSIGNITSSITGGFSNFINTLLGNNKNSDTTSGGGGFGAGESGNTDGGTDGDGFGGGGTGDSTTGGTGDGFGGGSTGGGFGSGTTGGGFGSGLGGGGFGSGGGSGGGGFGGCSQTFSCSLPYADLIGEGILKDPKGPKNVVDPKKPLALQCSDSLDNDSDGLVDTEDPSCHTDFDATNSNSYVATLNNESTQGSLTSSQTTVSADICYDDPLIFTALEQAQLDALLKRYYLLAPTMKSDEDIKIISDDIFQNQSTIEQAVSLTNDCKAQKADPSYTGPQTIKDNPYYRYVAPAVTTPIGGGSQIGCGSGSGSNYLDNRNYNPADPTGQYGGSFGNIFSDPFGYDIMNPSSGNSYNYYGQGCQTSSSSSTTSSSSPTYLPGQLSEYMTKIKKDGSAEVPGIQYKRNPVTDYSEIETLFNIW